MRMAEPITQIRGSRFCVLGSGCLDGGAGEGDGAVPV